MNLPKTRKEAKEQSSTHYFTGKPCKNGHIDKRLTSTGNCCGCMAGHRKTWHQNNREKSLEQMKDHYQRNHDHIRQQQAEWREENLDRKREMDRHYGQKHKEKKAEYLSRYYHENKDLYQHHRQLRRARLNNASVELTDAEVERLKGLIRERDELNRKEGKAAYHLDHIIPISKGGKHHPDNLQIITASENLSKSNKLPADL